jgi:Domain of Unknown Function (DUF1080)
VSEFESLFDGETLNGWHAIPRSYGTLYPGGPRLLDVLTGFPPDYEEQSRLHPAAWTVEDGAIVGRQSPRGSGYGGYLVSDRPFGDFELELDARADWPADTGIRLRRRPDTWEGIQVLFDYRQSGSIGGFYGNGIGAFHVAPIAIDAKRDEEGRVIGLKLDDPATSVEPFTPAKRGPLSAACTFEEFEAIWCWEDWNHFSIRCVGDCPTVTVRINGPAGRGVRSCEAEGGEL